LRPGAPLEISKPFSHSAQKVKIEYFEDRYGRVDPIVQLLAHKRVEYEWVGVDRFSWLSRKASGDAGEMQILPIVTF